MVMLKGPKGSANKRTSPKSHKAVSKAHTQQRRSISTKVQRKVSHNVDSIHNISYESTLSPSINASSPITTPIRGYKPRPKRWVRRGVVSDGLPVFKNKDREALMAEVIFLSTPNSYAKPENSLRDWFFRLRMEHWDKFRQDNPQLKLPEVAPYEIDRTPKHWPPYNTYAKPTEKQPLIFYRKSWLKYPEPSFIHVIRVGDKIRKNGHSRTTNLTAWQTWRGLTKSIPGEVHGRGKSDWRRLNPDLGFMTQEIWNKLRAKKIQTQFLPRPACYDESLAPAYFASEKARHDEIIESTRSKVV